MQLSICGVHGIAHPSSYSRSVTFTEPGMCCTAAPSHESVQKRINKAWALPYGMLTKDSPPIPQAVDDPEEVTEQG